MITDTGDLTRPDEDRFDTNTTENCFLNRLHSGFRELTSRLSPRMEIIDAF